MPTDGAEPERPAEPVLRGELLPPETPRPGPAERQGGGPAGGARSGGPSGRPADGGRSGGDPRDPRDPRERGDRGGVRLDPREVAELRRFRDAVLRLTPRVWAVKLLVSINAGIFLAMVASGVSLYAPSIDALLAWGANFGPRTATGEWWRLLTCTFVHAGLFHVALNMWVLWDAGPLVERLVGNVGFLVLYLVSGLCGSLASIAWNPAVTSVGASGAVFGVIGALGAAMLTQRRRVPRRILTPLSRSLAAFVLINTVIGLRWERIDSAAHMGGLAAGFACGLLLGRRTLLDEARGRGARNAAAAVLGAAVLVAGALLIPRAPYRALELIERFYAIEVDAMGAFDEVRERLEAGTLAPADAVATVEQRSIVPWREFRASALAVDDAPPELRAELDRRARFAALRVEGFELIVEAFRAGGDPERMQRAGETFRQAIELMEGR